MHDNCNDFILSLTLETEILRKESKSSSQFINNNNDKNILLSESSRRIGLQVDAKMDRRH